jgi:DNA-binding transcriptional ArsR family regulator
MIWKALADPTRRTILNLLKKAPQTTGELSIHFVDLSRYAVMKHLGVLEKANLITIKREGKFRWNHLNTKPIQQTYEQWVGNLIQLRMLAEQTTDDMSQSDKTITTTTVFIELKLNAGKLRAWQALTQEISFWWKKDFKNKPKTIDFVLESKLGGLMYENAGNNQGLVWASVIGLDAPNSLQLKGHLSPEHGGPAISFTKIELEEKNENLTNLKLSDTVFGSISNELQTELSRGWKSIFEQGLKPYLEKDS